MKKPQAVSINLDDIKIDEDYLSERVANINKDLVYLNEQKNQSELAKQHNEIIKNNYQRQIQENPFNFINAKQMQCIDLVLKGVPKNKICQQLEISRTALNSWYRDERFLEVLETTKKDFDESNTNYFRSLVPKALTRLAQVFDDEFASNKDIISATKVVLSGANLLDPKTDTSATYNQTQIIINPVQNDNVREIDNVAIDVDVVSKE